MKTHISNIYKSSLIATKINNFSKEWNVEYNLIRFVRLLLSVISLLTAFSFGYYYLSLILNTVLAIILTIVFLTLFEIFSVRVQLKTFKYLINNDIRTFLALLIPSILLFAASFYSSSQGIAMYVKQSNVKKEIIKNDFDLQKQAINKKIDAQKTPLISELNNLQTNFDKSIAYMQQRNIRQINNQLLEIEDKRETEINKLSSEYSEKQANEKTKTNIEAKNYFYVVGFFIIFQLLTSFLLVFLAHGIQKDMNKNYLKNNTLTVKLKYIENEISNKINETADNLVLSMINKDNEQTSFNHVTNVNTLGFKAQETAKTEPKQENKTNTFEPRYNAPVTNEVSNIRYNDTVTNAPVPNEVSSAQNNEPETHIKTCLQCGKEFEPYSITHKFCSSKCRLKWHKINDGFDIEKHITKKHKNTKKVK